MGKQRKPDEIDLETLYSALLQCAKKFSESSGTTLPKDMKEFVFSENTVNFSLWNLGVNPDDIEKAKTYAMKRGWLELVGFSSRRDGYKLTKNGMESYSLIV